jgi:hypothetical protein
MSTAFLPALEQARLIREGAVSPLEIVEEYLERIERIDAELNSFVTVCTDEALAEARDPRPGPFSGVPVPIKDLADTAGIRTTYSSRAYADYVPAEDSALVRRIREAGFIVLGKTNTPEFGTTAVTESDLNGICRNPWSLLLRALRSQAHPRADVDRAARQRSRFRDLRPACTHGRRRSRVPRRHLGARAGRSPRCASAGASVRRGGRAAPGAAPRRPRPRRAFTNTRRSRVRGRGAGGCCAPRGAGS